MFYVGDGLGDASPDNTHFGSFGLKLNLPLKDVHSKEPENGFCFWFVRFFSAAD